MGFDTFKSLSYTSLFEKHGVIVRLNTKLLVFKRFFYSFLALEK